MNEVTVLMPQTLREAIKAVVKLEREAREAQRRLTIGIANVERFQIKADLDIPSKKRVGWL